MIAVAGTVAGVVVIICAPVPTALKVLALVPIILAVGMVLAEEIQVARANVRAAQERDTELAVSFFDALAQLPDAEWEQVIASTPRIPSQRKAPE